MRQTLHIFRRLIIVAAIAGLIIAAIATATAVIHNQNQSQGGEATPVLFHPMIRSHRANAANDVTVSANWSGYVWTGQPGTYSSIAVTFQLPGPYCNLSDPGADTLDNIAMTGFWAGLDGYNNQTVEQAGAAKLCSPGGWATFESWTEMFPAPPVELEPLNAYQTVRVTVGWQGGDAYQTDVNDVVTVGQVSGAQRDSAEIITEAPTGAVILPTAQFHAVSYRFTGPIPGQRHAVELADPTDGTAVITGPIRGPAWRRTFTQRWFEGTS